MYSLKQFPVLKVSITDMFSEQDSWNVIKSNFILSPTILIKLIQWGEVPPLTLDKKSCSPKIFYSLLSNKKPCSHFNSQTHSP